MLDLESKRPDTFILVDAISQELTVGIRETWSADASGGTVAAAAAVTAGC